MFHEILPSIINQVSAFCEWIFHFVVSFDNSCTCFALDTVAGIMSLQFMKCHRSCHKEKYLMHW